MTDLRSAMGHILFIRPTAAGGSGTSARMRDVDAPRDAPATSARAAVAHHVVELMYKAVLVADRALTIRFCNPAAGRLLGVPAGELVGRRVADFVPREQRLEHAARVAEFLGSPLASRPMSERRVSAVRADGVEVRCDVSIGATDDGSLVFAVVRDVSDLERQVEDRITAEQARHRLESRFHAIIEDSPNPIVIVDADDLRIIYDNPAARHLYGSALLVGRFDASTLVPLASPDDAVRIVQAFERLASGELDRAGLRLSIRHPEWESVRVIDLAISRLVGEPGHPELLLRAVDVPDDRI